MDRDSHGRRRRRRSPINGRAVDGEAEEALELFLPLHNSLRAHSFLRFLLTVSLSELSAIFGPFHLTSATATVVVSTSSGHGSRSILRTTNRASNFRDSNGGHDRHLIILATIDLFSFTCLGFFQKAKKAPRPPLLPFFSFSFLFFLHCFSPTSSSSRLFFTATVAWPAKEGRPNPTERRPGTDGGRCSGLMPGEPESTLPGPNQHASVLGDSLRRTDGHLPFLLRRDTLILSSPSPLPTTSEEASSLVKEGIRQREAWTATSLAVREGDERICELGKSGIFYIF